MEPMEPPLDPPLGTQALQYLKMLHPTGASNWSCESKLK